MVIAAPVIRAPSERIFGPEVVGPPPGAAAGRGVGRGAAVHLFTVSSRPRGLPPTRRADAMAPAVLARTVALHGRRDLAGADILGRCDRGGIALELLRRPDRRGDHGV